MLNFKLFGIPIFVQPFFLLIMAIFGGALDLLSSPSQVIFFEMLVFMIAGFLSILIHELGHALMMKRYGRHPQIVLHGFGGVAISSGQEFTKGQSLLVTIMGPLSQIVLGLLAFFLYQQVGEKNFPTPQSEHFVQSLYFVSIFWAIINLIPIFPLDGGQIMAALVGKRNRKAVHIISIVIAGAIIALILLSGQLMIFGIVILAMLIMDNVKAIKN